MDKSLVRIIKLGYIGLMCVLVVLLYRQALYHGSKYQELMLESRHEPDTSMEMSAGGATNRAGYKTTKISTQVSMEERRHRVLQVCQNMGYNISETRLPRALVSESKAVVYCPVEKTASTFFRRFLYQLEHTTPMRSPFDVPVKLIYGCPNIFTTLQQYASNLMTAKGLAKREEKPPQRSKETSETLQHFLQKSTKFVFVRDPYSRLFSAYTDKLVAPNPHFWATWGKPAIRKYRKKPTEISLKCGHDVTFQEFLSFVLNLNPKSEGSDPHLRPITDLCRPCNFNYTVIGHMNTFDDDVVYLSSIVNVTRHQLELEQLAADSAKDAIEDSVHDAFTIWSSRIAKCMSKLQAGKRIWTKLQFRGIVSGRAQFPFQSNPSTIESMDAKGFIQNVLNALESSKDINELQRQKREAISQAYKSVSRDILDKIAKMYDADFNIFGFDSKPAYIFENRPTT